MFLYLFLLSVIILICIDMGGCLRGFQRHVVCSVNPLLGGGSTLGCSTNQSVASPGKEAFLQLNNETASRGSADHPRITCRLSVSLPFLIQRSAD
jgi:hypothetical protein